ncbi:Aspartic proteinase nepenthesin-2-like protein [Drosera capensis]
MASSLPSFTLLLITTLHLAIEIAPSSASDNILSHDSKTSIRVPVHHRDAGKGYTKYELLYRAVQRGKHRLQRFTSSATTPFMGVSPSYSAGGENVCNISMGTPGQNKVYIVDTGSDLCWAQCKPCTNCFTQVTALYDPSKSSTYRNVNCSNQFCKDLLPSSSCDTNNNCMYSYGYGDQSTTQGNLSTDTLTFVTTQGNSTSLAGIVMGCGTNNQGTFSGTDGLIGLGQGPLSLASQQQQGNKKIAYCVVTFASSDVSHIYIGSPPLNKFPNNSQSTPIQKNDAYPTYYYVLIQGISVNGKPLSYPQSSFTLNKDGSGGTIIDSGTTLTYLPAQIIAAIKAPIYSSVKLIPSLFPSASGLSTCWYYTGGPFPNVTMTYHFAGGANMTIPNKNMFIEDSSAFFGFRLICLVTEPSTSLGSSLTPLSIFGNLHQQNYAFKYDLDNKMITFAPQKCSIW